MNAERTGAAPVYEVAGGPMLQTTLEGVRVLDLTLIWSGPYATRMLADMGAEVIKIERLEGRGPASRPATFKIGDTPFPTYPNRDPGEHPWNRDGMFNKMNRNKRSLTLKLTTPEGVDVFKRLAAISDVVIDNYSARVMDNFGLGYPVLSRLNPAIIMCSMPAYGMTGPYRDYVALGTSVEPSAGLSQLMGYRDSGPYKMGHAYSDPIAGLNALAAILSALWYRRQTGRGQFIDLSQCEASTCLMGEVVLGYQMTVRVPLRLGNRHAFSAPHGVYRCRGEDRWIAIAVTTDSEWHALRQVMGDPAWARDNRFTTALERWRYQDDLDRLIEEWTNAQDQYEAMHMLQQAGVPAFPAIDARQMVEEPHLNARGYLVEVSEPEAGTFRYPGLPLRFSRTPAQRWDPAPLLGQHNERVLGTLLGMAPSAVASLARAGIIGTRPPG